MGAKLIVNPRAGRDTATSFLPHINEKLRAITPELDIVLTTQEGDGMLQGQRAALEGCNPILVAGGDGTLNEVLNGVALVSGALRQTTFGLIPLGTGNDFAQGLGIPEDVSGALKIIQMQRSLPVDLGLLNGRRFVNVSAGGFMAQVSDAVDPQLKTLAGKLAYLIGGASVLFDFEPAAAQVAVRTARGVWQRSVQSSLFAVCNSRMAGGGRLIAPQAFIDDGELDLCLIEAMPLVRFVSLLTRVSDGEHVEDPQVIYVRGQEIDITLERPTKVNTDGEILELDKCQYRIEPKALRIYAMHAPASVAGASPG